MGFINILDTETANRIAAGEVVERPSSAVKELLENSLDAGARTVTLEIKDGGRSFIRVSDDGSGILRDDVPKALLRHATSKTECGSDLVGIRTLGFRGEALAAIASVSRMEIITKHRDEELGTLLTSDENGVVMSDTGCPDGTTVIVRDVFYNTPARQKFLKRDATEGASCVAVAEKLALSRTDVAVSVIVDGQRRFTTSGDGKLYSAIYSVYGREFAKSLEKIEYELEGVSVYGYASRAGEPRGSRAMQMFFVNGRYVKSRTVQAALEEAFSSYIPRGKYPAGVIFVSLNPDLIDVNVHPAKTEVKFASEKDVFRAVYHAVHNALASAPAVAYDEPEKNITGQDEASVAKAVLELESKMAHRPPEIPAYTPPKKSYRSFDPTLGEEDMQASPAPMTLSDSCPVPQKSEPISEITDTAEEITIFEQKPAYRVIGQAYDAYIFVQTDSEILVIDKHAAHERILYEELLEKKELHTQKLLSGITVTLTSEEAAILLENADFLAEKGFETEDFGEGSIIVRSVPMSLSNTKNLADILQKFASELTSGNGLSFAERCDRALYTVACKAALKAGIKNSPEDDARVVELLFENPSLRVCPHGRPFIFTISKRDIEKRFDR